MFLKESAEEEFQITTDGASQEVPSIYCDRVVWQDLRHGNYDIYIAYLDVVCETEKSEESKKYLPIDRIMKILGLWPKE